MKQPFLLLSILISLSICFSCEQIQEEISNRADEETTENEKVEERINTRPSRKNSSSSFIASMRNAKHINTYIEASNKQIVDAMEETVKIKVQYQELIPTAIQIQDLTSNFHDYIFALKDLIAQESKGVYTQFDAETKGNIDLIGMPKDGSNKEVIEQVFISGQYGGVNTQEQQGPVLYKKLLQLRKDYLDAIESLWDNGGIRGTVFADPSKKQSLLEDISNNILLVDPNNSDRTTWVDNNFQDKTIEDAYVFLTQCQNQVNLSTAAVLNSLSKNMGKLEMTYDKFDVFAQSSKPYVMLGETYESEIALGAYSSQAKFAVSVDGRNLSVIDGKARFSTRAASIGEKSYNAKISVRNPLTGEVETFTKTFQYEVGQPAVLVSPDKQNVLYIGVDNPITLAAAGISTSAMQVSASGASIKKVSSTGYVVNVQREGNVLITIKNVKDGKSYPFQFRAKRIPDPVVRIGNKVDGLIKSGEFKAQAGMMAILENFDYDAKCTVQSYTLYYTRKRQDPVEIKGMSARFSSHIASAVKQAKPGDQYAFTDVKVRCSGDKAGRRVNGLSFKIR